MSTIVSNTDGIDVQVLLTRIEELEETIEQQKERIDELEESHQDYQADNELDKAQIRQRITEVENQQEETSSEGTNPRGSTPEGPLQPKTPLEQLTSLPQHLAEEQLTANIERARFVSRDVLDYAQKAPAGYVLDSSTIRKVLTAKEESSVHTQTVARVMDYMDQFGKDEIELKKRRGKKIIVVSPDAAERLSNSLRGDGVEGDLITVAP